MSKSKLGRNPFSKPAVEKEPFAEREEAPKNTETQEHDRSGDSEPQLNTQAPLTRLASWFGTELPAELFVLGLKTAVLVKDSIESFSSKRASRDTSEAANSRPPSTAPGDPHSFE